ncbi:uncharacterized protein LOC144338785 [Macaca mulatta]
MWMTSSWLLLQEKSVYKVPGIYSRHWVKKIPGIRQEGTALSDQEAIVRQPPDRWITNARLTHYQALLLDTDHVQFGPLVTLNPATLLPVPEDQPSPHDCRQVLAETHGTREDLKDQELPDADHTWYTDGSSYLDSGTRRVGAAVVDGHNTIWAQSLPPGTSAQKAELIALTKALELSKGKKANIYTDSRSVKGPKYA